MEGVMEGEVELVAMAEGIEHIYRLMLSKGTNMVSIICGLRCGALPSWFSSRILCPGTSGKVGFVTNIVHVNVDICLIRWLPTLLACEGCSTRPVSVTDCVTRIIVSSE